MLKSIVFKKDYRCFKKGFSLKFKPLTLLVGDQGCGKSTLLHLLSNVGKIGVVRTEDVLDIEASPISTRAFDYEKDNPRHGDVHTKIDVFSRMVSHGEFVRKLNESICDEKGVCWLQDEPDACLSIRSCLHLARQIKQALENGSQVIASIHSPTVMSQFEEVYSLEARQWMTPAAFIQSQNS